MQVSEFSIIALSEIITGDSDLTPYLSGPNLVKIFNKLGFRDVYSFQDGGLPEKLSRNKYVIKRMQEINGSKQFKELIELIVDGRRFIKEKLDVQEAVNEINNIIKFDNYQLENFENKYKISGEFNYDDEIDIEVHFEDIQKQIIEQIENAQYIIWVAVAWFTDRELFTKLYEMKNKGVNVQIIVLDDEINKKYGFNYGKYFEAYKIEKFGAYDNIMHNKFCIIDLKTVIHGSYNWTNKAQFNKETITIDNSRELAEKFAKQFIALKVGE